MAIERLDNRLGVNGEEFVSVVRRVLALTPHVLFERVKIDHDLDGDMLCVRVTIPAARQGYRKVFRVRRPPELERALTHYVMSKYGSGAA